MFFKNGRKTVEDAPPVRFSRRFVEVIGQALEQGCLTLLRAVGLLALPVGELEELFAAHGVTCPRGLSGR